MSFAMLRATNRCDLLSSCDRVYKKSPNQYDIHLTDRSPCMIKYVHITLLLHVIIVKFLTVIINMLVDQSRYTVFLTNCFLHSNRDTLKGHHEFLHSHPDTDVQGHLHCQCCLETPPLGPTENGRNKHDHCLLVPKKNYEDFFYKG